MSDWHLRGTILVACNCDYGCPCNFNALPTTGHCEGAWTWEVVEIELEPIANPVTGAEVHPGAVLPEGIVFKEGSFARTRRHLSGAVEYDHSGQHASFGLFEYSGP